MLWLALAGLGVYLLGAVIYCGVTWRWVARFGPARPLSVALVELLRELALVLLVQPFLPFGYLVGRRSGRAGTLPVVLVHGYFQNRLAFVYLRRALAKRGLGPVFALNYPFWQSIERASGHLARFVEQVLAETGASKVALVGHSLGGLVALDYVTHCGGAAKVGRCVTLGSPHRGVIFRGPMLSPAARDLRRGSTFLTVRASTELPVPSLSLASPFDNVVFPASRSSLEARGGVDKLIGTRGHFGLLFDEEVARATADFLSSG
jgi:triacylglycerol lipase